MKNVLHFIGSFHQGGSERQALQLAKLLKNEGTFKIFLAALNKQGILLEEAEKACFTEIPEFPLNSFYDTNFLIQLRKCARFLRENKIEIVHTHDFYTNVFGMFAAKSARIPFKIASKRETFRMRSKPQVLVEKLAFRLADKIVANSEAVKNYLIRERIPARKIQVICNGLDLERFSIEKKNKAVICNQLGLPFSENIKFITLVANLRHKVKNQLMFLRAAQKVLQKFPEAHFVLAGEGELKENLENLAKKLKIAENTHFIGRCQKIPELLSISYACVLTSFAEGFSNSILEYMAAGKPVVATNVGGAAEAIVEGETGFLVNSDDDKAMAKRLIELLQDEGKAVSFGKRGREIVEAKFSTESQLNKTLELYGKFSEFIDNP
ncbi:MAG TPA: glycosyltransferase [Pyrinomonadaceae bacterium]|nr:glycosyltransferase [Pyrinomonadaceae bacterium]